MGLDAEDDPGGSKFHNPGSISGYPWGGCCPTLLSCLNKDNAPAQTGVKCFGSMVS